MYIYTLVIKATLLTRIKKIQPSFFIVLHIPKKGGGGGASGDDFVLFHTAR